MQNLSEAESAKMREAVQALDPAVRARLFSMMSEDADADEGGGPTGGRSSSTIPPIEAAAVDSLDPCRPL